MAGLHVAGLHAGLLGRSTGVHRVDPDAGDPGRLVRDHRHRLPGGGDVRRSRQIANQRSDEGGRPATVAKTLAAETGRSIETIRYTLKQFDKSHPELAIFPDKTGPLTEEVKARIFEQYRRGASVDELCRRFCRTKTSIYRVVNEMRASHIMELPDFITAYADPAIRDEIPEVSYSASIVTDEEVAEIMAQGGRHSPEHVAAQVALGDALIDGICII